MEHDFKGLIEGLEECDKSATIIKGHEAHKTILFALRLAEKVTGEPSLEMIRATRGGWAYDTVFKAMINHACKEVGDD